MRCLVGRACAHRAGTLFHHQLAQGAKRRGSGLAAVEHDAFGSPTGALGVSGAPCARGALSWAIVSEGEYRAGIVKLEFSRPGVVRRKADSLGIGCDIERASVARHHNLPIAVSAAEHRLGVPEGHALSWVEPHAIEHAAFEARDEQRMAPPGDASLEVAIVSDGRRRDRGPADVVEMPIRTDGVVEFRIKLFWIRGEQGLQRRDIVEVVKVGLARDRDVWGDFRAVLGRVFQGWAILCRREICIGVGLVVAEAQHVGPAEVGARHDQIDCVIAVRPMVDSKEFAVWAERHALSIANAPGVHVAFDATDDGIVGGNGAVRIKAQDLALVVLPVTGLHFIVRWQRLRFVGNAEIGKLVRALVADRIIKLSVRSEDEPPRLMVLRGRQPPENVYRRP